MNKFFAFSGYIVLITFFCSCSNNIQKPDTDAISFDNNESILSIGQQLVVTPTIKGKIAKLENCKWENLSKDLVDLTISPDRSIILTGKKFGKANLKLTDTVNNISADYIVEVKISKIKKWVAFGNSITKHPITSFWWGEWGMAATAKEKDYVHLFNSLLESHFQTKISFQAVNVGNWEREFRNFNKNSLNQYLNGDEDLIIVRLGENVPSEEDTFSIYEQELTDLIHFLKSKSPYATYVITGNFWSNPRKDRIQKNVADKNYCIWVPLSQLDLQENKSTIDTKVLGQNGIWRSISEAGSSAAGVAYHPSDKGMYNIAATLARYIIESN